MSEDIAILQEIKGLRAQLTDLQNRFDEMVSATELMKLKSENERLTSMLEEKVTASKAAAILCVSPQTIARLRDSGQLKAVLIGKTYKYPMSAINKFVERRTR